MLPLTILLSSLVGAIVGIALIVLAKTAATFPSPSAPISPPPDAGTVLGQAADPCLPRHFLASCRWLKNTAFSPPISQTMRADSERPGQV